jgi:hypothetical protein
MGSQRGRLPTVRTPLRSACVILVCTSLAMLLGDACTAMLMPQLHASHTLTHKHTYTRAHMHKLPTMHTRPPSCHLDRDAEALLLRRASLLCRSAAAMLSSLLLGGDGSALVGTPSAGKAAVLRRRRFPIVPLRRGQAITVATGEEFEVPVCTCRGCATCSLHSRLRVALGML